MNYNDFYDKERSDKEHKYARHTLLTDRRYIGLFLVFLVTFMLFTKFNFLKRDSFKEELLLVWGENTCYHIHHWITFSIFLVLMYLSRYSNTTTFYVFVTMVVASISEDFLFRDIFQIKEKC